VQVVLEEFATLEGTKQPVSRSELVARLPELKTIVDDCLKALTDRRVLRQLDEAYELAHDSLARRIADTRSAERKTLLKVQKLVKDRWAGYGQTGTLLNREEIGFITPYLPKLPLSKEETTFVARSRTKVRRRQNLAWAATAVFVSFLIIVIVVVVRARGQAEGAITAARAVVGAVARIRAKLDRIPGTEEVRRDLGESVARLNRQLGLGEFGIQREASTAFWAALQEGDVLMAKHEAALKEGDVQLAKQHAAAAGAKYATSREIAEGEVKDHSANAEWQRNLAISYESLGDADKAAGEYPKASDWYGKALAIAEHLAAADPKNVQAQHDVIVAETALAIVEASTGRQADAITRYERVVALAEPLVDTTTTDADLQRDLLTVYQNVAELQRTSDKMGAQAALRKALVIAETRTQTNPQDAVARNDVSMLYTALGDLVVANGGLAEAQGYYIQALKHDEEVAVLPQRNLEVSYNRLGDLEMDLGKWNTARGWYQKALPLAELLADSFPDNTVAQRDRFVSYFSLGAAENAGGNRAAARAWFEKGRKSAESRAVGGDPDGRADLDTVLEAIATLDRPAKP
jgi:tetratricopeptide (TPR) repeat protein